MVQLGAAARDYFARLIEQQGVEGLAIRLTAVHPGTPRADCRLEFCEPDEVRGDDYLVECEGFSLVIDRHSAPFLDNASIDFEQQRTGGTLTVRAPHLKGTPPDASASVVERVRYVIDTEINPGVASHGGKVHLVEVSADGVVVLRFGGGCHGCGNVDLTLRNGIERTLKERVPEVSAVVDATDHSSGENPYIRRT